jgi:hypothetical protein
MVLGLAGAGAVLMGRNSSTGLKAMYLRAEHLNLVYECAEPKKLDEHRTLSRREMGELKLPSGRIMACDPIAFQPFPPFTVTVKPGSYPGTAYIINYAENNDNRVALAAVFFNDEKAVRWEMALISKKQRLADLEEGSFFGYPVDAGAGGFMSAEAADFYEAKMREDYEQNRDKYEMDIGGASVFIGGLFDDMPWDKLIEKFQADYVPTYSVLNEELEGSGGLNMLMFSSGLGDGHYPSYFGYDQNGQVSCLVTDFLIIDEDVY